MFRSVPGSRPKTSSVFGCALLPVRARMSASCRSMRSASAFACRFDADASAQRADGLGDVGQAAVDVRVVRHVRALELLSQVRLGAVENHQVGPQREDPLHVGIEQGADPRQPIDLGREPVVAPDGDQPIAGAHREQHLGGRGDDAR